MITTQGAAFAPVWLSMSLGLPDEHHSFHIDFLLASFTAEIAAGLPDFGISLVAYPNSRVSLEWALIFLSTAKVKTRDRANRWAGG